MIFFRSTSITQEFWVPEENFVFSLCFQWSSPKENVLPNHLLQSIFSRFQGSSPSSSVRSSTGHKCQGLSGPSGSSARVPRTAQKRSNISSSFYWLQHPLAKVFTQKRTSQFCFSIFSILTGEEEHGGKAGKQREKGDPQEKSFPDWPRKLNWNPSQNIPHCWVGTSLRHTTMSIPQCGSKVSFLNYSWRMAQIQTSMEGNGTCRQGLDARGC